jgi:hypothetical protein
MAGGSVRDVRWARRGPPAGPAVGRPPHATCAPGCRPAVAPPLAAPRTRRARTERAEHAPHSATKHDNTTDIIYCFAPLAVKGAHQFFLPKLRRTLSLTHCWTYSLFRLLTHGLDNTHMRRLPLAQGAAAY